MSQFVTSCPHCQTCFKVSFEQIDPYQGLARCGVCASTFNAREHALESVPEAISSDSLPSDQTLQDPSDQVVQTNAATFAFSESTSSSAQGNTEVDAASAEAINAELEPVPAVLRVRPNPLGRPLTPPDSSLEDDAGESELDQHLKGQSITIPSAEDLTLGRSTEDEFSADVNTVYTSAPEQKDNSFQPFNPYPLNRPKPRTGLWMLVSLGMLLLLVLQIGWVSRHWMVRAIPATEPLFSALCTDGRCEVADSFDIKKIAFSQPGFVLDSAEPSQTDSDNNRVYKLSFKFNLRNHADVEMPVPALQLSIRNIAGEEVIRKVFLSAEYLPMQANTQADLAPNEERQIVLPLELTWTEVGDISPTVAIFYP